MTFLPKGPDSVTQNQRLPVLVLTLTLLFTSNPGALCSLLIDEAHFEIMGAHIYVVPKNGLFHKIEKGSGRVVWKSQKMYKGLAHEGGSYTNPVFFDNRFFTTEMFSVQLISVDCDTGHMVMEQEYRLTGPTAYYVFAPILCDNVLICGTDYDIQAFGLGDMSRKWNLGYGSGDFIFLSGYFQRGSTLYLLNDTLIDKSLYRKGAPDIFEDMSLRRFEMVELDCQTGKALNRFDRHYFFGGLKVKINRGFNLGQWKGRELILIDYSDNSGRPFHRLFAFDPISNSIEMVIQQIDDIDAGEVNDEASVEGNLMCYPENKANTLVTKNLSTGKTLWRVKRIEPREKIWATSADRLFTGIEKESSIRQICRSASTGNLIWQKTISKSTKFGHLYEIEVSDGRLYILTTDYIRALDAGTGNEIWKVRLTTEEEGFLNRTIQYLREIF